ncbi:MAG TPA: MotA/TolQ/ExbB proton channel family protein [Kofleriaceae bacterium]|jgi:biopolymer transport protein ExbB
MTHGDGIDATLLDLMLRAGSAWVLWLLLLLSLAAVAVMAERLWFYASHRTPPAKLAEAITALRANGAEAAAKVLAGDHSLQAEVVRSCLERAADGAASVEEHRAAIIEAQRVRYEQRLAFLGTLGNNAPFIGLFGTVLGIIRAVSDLSSSSMANTQAVMTGIAQALVATGVGLLVALPAVATYNAFMRHVETSASAAESAAHEVLAYLRKEA